MASICGPPPCTTTGLIAVCSKQHDVAGEVARQMLRAHGMAAVFDDDDRLVIALHIGQGFRKDAGLLVRRYVHWELPRPQALFSRSRAPGKGQLATTPQEPASP